MSERTIAAIATPLGEGGIGVIRISGSDAINVADRCFAAFSGEKLSSLSGYQASYGKVFDCDGNTLDDAVALVFKAPKSYTGEDVVEISVHGGSVIIKQVLRRVLECGAAMASGGEFTKRAFLNGKLDLTKAESVMGLISARNDAAAKISRGAREGRISRDTEDILNKLLETAASLAAFADYPDEDIPNLNEEIFSRLLGECYEKCQKLISTYDMGRIIREGVNCAIVGKPNVGKSTLMNMLCGSDRSIVTDIAGTTRDVVENVVTIGDITLNLADTAGIRESDDTVEKIGVERAKKAIEGADIVLFLMDSATPETPEEIELYKEISTKKHLRVENKEDIKSFPRVADISIEAKTGKGIEELIDMMLDKLDIEKIATAVPLTSERHLHAVKTAIEAIESAIDNFYAVPIDCTSVDVKSAYRALAELTGEDVDENIVNEIFSRFCVGK